MCMQIEIDDIPQGESWACTYTVTVWLDQSGKPIETPQNLQPGQAHPGVPGSYTGTGILQIRDRAKQLVQLWDPALQKTVVVHYKDTDAWDTVEWI